MKKEGKKMLEKLGIEENLEKLSKNLVLILQEVRLQVI